MKFYVYGLIDPRTNQLFYIGKGQRSRCRSHLTETKETTSNPKKFNKIQSIRASGHEPTIKIIARFASEDQAYDYEAQLINELPDLTNLQPGGKGGVGNSEWKTDNPSSKIKGLSYEDRYGVEKAAWMKEIRSEKLKGRQFSEDSKRRMSESAIKRDHSYKQIQIQTPTGVYDSLRDAAIAFGISDSAMSQRLSSSNRPDFYRINFEEG